MRTRDGSLGRLTVFYVVIALAGTALWAAGTPAPPKATVAAPLNPGISAAGQTAYKLFPDLVVLPPTVHTSLTPASGTNPAGYKVVWKIKNQGTAATANRVKLVLSCQPAAGMAAAPPTPQQAQQICFTLNNASYLSYPPDQPPSAQVPLKPGQESEPFIDLSTTAAVSCNAWHAKITAVVDADGKYDEGPVGEGNNTKVFEICEMKAWPK